MRAQRIALALRRRRCVRRAFVRYMRRSLTGVAERVMEKVWSGTLGIDEPHGIEMEFYTGTPEHPGPLLATYRPRPWMMA